MKRLAGLLALLLGAPLAAQWVPSTAGWQVAGVVPPPATGTVTTTSTLVSGRVALSSGAASLTDDAGCSWSGTGNAFLLSASGVLAGPGTIKIGYDSGSGDYGLHLASFTKVGWSSTVGPSGAPDLAISRPSAGLLLVEDGSGSPRDVQARTVFAPTVSAAPDATGTNTAGINLTIQPQAPTGNATPTSLVFKTPSVGASGTTAQTQTTRLTLTETVATFTTPSIAADYGLNVSASQQGLSASGGATVIRGSTIYLQGTSGAAVTAVVPNGPVRLAGYTVATLPAGTVGDTAYVTDATAPTYLGTLTGGGAVTTPVFYNGSAWVSH